MNDALRKCHFFGIANIARRLRISHTFDRNNNNLNAFLLFYRKVEK